MPPKFPQRKFISVDPYKCTGCGICELACSQEKSEATPLQSRIRVVRMKPLFDFALACRSCEDAKCIKACPEKAITQNQETGCLIIDEKKCKGCDWCVQACEYGGIVIHPEKGLAVACDMCGGGEPQCVRFCPEEAIETVSTDEEAEKRLRNTFERLPKETERIAALVRNKDWSAILAEGEKRSIKISQKLEELNKKAKNKPKS
jgi:Fe-S-cluster-containing hydrogenase component 2